MIGLGRSAAEFLARVVPEANNAISILRAGWARPTGA